LGNNHALSELLTIPPYSLGRNEKPEILTALLAELTRHHYEKCPSYRRMLDALSVDPNSMEDCSDIPFLPVRLFKKFELLSVDRSAVVKTMTSSGTTGQAVAKIYLDKETSANQQRVLVKIVSDFIGSHRLPMLILDCPSVIKNRAMFSARGAGILGFSIFGVEKVYALDDEMRLQVGAIRDFLTRHSGETVLLFGFTFMVWKHFCQELLKLDEPLDLSRGILIHGGGWKKLAGEAVTPDEFKRLLKETCGLVRVYDYYGMVEQTGSIFMECEHGNLHAPVFSEVIVRRPVDFSPADFGEKGIIEVLSVLPGS